MATGGLGRAAFRSGATLLALVLSVVLLQQYVLSRKDFQHFARRPGGDTGKVRTFSNYLSTEAFCCPWEASVWLACSAWLASCAVLSMATRSRNTSGTRQARRQTLGKLAMLASTALLCTAFVGPPRDRQPSLWDAPARADSKQPDEKLSKRVRAVAIGSASGILLSLVVQGVLRNPEEEPVQAPRQQAKRSQLSQPSRTASQSDAPGPDLTWIGTLSTGVVIGLSVGFNVGTNQNPQPAASQETAEKKRREELSAHKVSADKVSELQNSQPVNR